MLDEPTGFELPPKGFAVEDAGLPGAGRRWQRCTGSCYILTQQRLQLLEPFAAWEGTDLKGFEIADQSKRKMYNGSYFYGRSMVEIPWSP